MSQWTSGCVAVAALGGVTLWLAAAFAPAAPGQANDDHLPAPMRAPRYVGAGSCASSACHGSTDPRGGKGCEYTTWMTDDPHVRAYESLLTERSRAIVKNYRQLKDIKDARPEKDALCLKCHSLDATAVLQGERVAHADGLSCERCHGPAEKWLTVHYLNDWATKPAKEKEALGFRDTKNLAKRAALCIECHVGTPDAQVDHDLYAAGHPRIYFEYSAFLAVLPPHWRVGIERQRHPDLQARTWAMGQVACAEASLNLLAYRAGKDSNPWPEFAEYNCFACHHDLKPDSRRIQGGYNGRVPGTLPWNDWYISLPGRVDWNGAPLGGADWNQTIAALRKEMDRPLPNRQRVAQQAQAASAQLHERLLQIEKSKPLSVKTLDGWYTKLYDQRQTLGADWDSAAQGYLALAALHNGITDLDPARKSAATRDRLRVMAAELQFPKGLDSPKLGPPYFRGNSKK